MICFELTGEYIAHTSEEIKHRPLYTIEELLEKVEEKDSYNDNHLWPNLLFVLIEY
jgi:hypothetical protein